MTWRGEERLEEVDLADLRGMADAKYAVEVAAAGGHAILLSGPKGAGKTSLAERIPSILPDLTPEESLELTAIHSLAGALEPGDGLITRPPYSAPHHDASKTSIDRRRLAGRCGPGEISRAHAGVLFLDEFPLFRTDIIEALRQPLESGDVTIARRDESVTLPARGMLVLACNPCPCGDYAVSVGQSRCTCRSQQLRDYRTQADRPARRPDRHHPARRRCSSRHERRLEPARPRPRSGPGWPRPGPASTSGTTAAAGASTARCPARCCASAGRCADGARRLLDDALYDGRLSSRGAVRVHRLALDRRRPRLGGVGHATSSPAPTRSRRRCGCAPVSRCSWPRCDRRAG